MKIGVSGPSIGGYDVQLPNEIITIILIHIQAITQERIRKRTLWSCCLLSKSWYSTAVPFLYEAPRLSNSNFDKFTQTICPPVNSHVRHVGLESFVRHLDMGHLAYESSKSLTARLLRRTRFSLEVFVAPAVSLSVSSLAPLSRCKDLRSLDLSRDSYGISLTQLLNAVGDLPNLTFLSLPRSALRGRCDLKPTTMGQGSWPPKLRSLRINDWLPQNAGQWLDLIRSWPPYLTSVAFDYCFNWTAFYQLDRIETPAIHVHNLQVGLRRGEDGFPIEILLSAFPNLVHLSIPTPAAIPDFTITSNSSPPKENVLKHLTFDLLPEVVQPRAILKTEFLSRCVEIHPRLTRIDVPEHYLDLEADESMEDLDQMERLMTTRATRLEEDVGIYLMEA